MRKLMDDFPYSLEKQDVEVVSKKSLFSRFFTVSLVSFKHKLFAGGWSETVEREIFERGDAVVVLPYDPALDKIVMVEQIRVGCMENARHPWAFELVGGMIEQGQSIESVALRETEEETGLIATDLIPMQSYLSSCGGTSERIFLYVAKVDSTKCGDICGLDYEHEDIKVHQFDSEQVFHWLENGKIDAAAVVIALQWFKLNKQQVLDKWAISS